MVIHVAMRPLSEHQTKWYITASSNFVPRGPIGEAILFNMVKKVALDEDGKQLANMASDEEKLKHSFKFTLPLDTIYAGWNKKYESANDLEKELMTIAVSGRNLDKLSTLGFKLKAYNTSKNLNNEIKNTTWELLWAKHKFPGTKIIEIFKSNKAREVTQMKNGTIIQVAGDIKKYNKNKILMKNLNGKIYLDDPNGLEFKLPFMNHTFETYYVSNKIFLRKGLQTNNWEIYKKINDADEANKIINAKSVNWNNLF